MKICHSRDLIRTCNHPMDHCDNCVPGYHKAFERVEDTDLNEYVERFVQQATELNHVIDELINLCTNSKLCERNKSYLITQIRLLSGVSTQIMNSGSTLFLNQLLGNNEINIPEEATENGSDTGLLSEV